MLVHLVDLFWADVTVVVARVEALAEGLLAVGAEVALLVARHLAVFMNFAVTTEPTFHKSNSGIEHPLILSTPQKSDALPIIDETQSSG